MLLLNKKDQKTVQKPEKKTLKNKKYEITV